MSRKLIPNGILLTILVVTSIFYIQGINDVPFHPDEATQIYMSQDIKLLFTSPKQLFWSPEQRDSIRQYYRLVDAPLTRYFIGIALTSLNLKPNEADWDWSSSWDENQAIGAVPSPDVLFTSRLVISIPFISSLLLIYLVTKNTFNQSAGIFAVALTATNAILLLHTRRAMAESLLFFTILLLLWILKFAPKLPWLLGITAGIALSAKQSSLPLAVVSLIAIVDIYPIKQYRQYPIKSIIRKLSLYIVPLITTYFILNPVYWGEFPKSLFIGLEERQELLSRQVVDWGNYGLFVKPGQSLLININNTYISTPVIAEVDKYEQINSVGNEYLANPTHTLMRGLFLGGLYLTLTIFGFIITLKNFQRYSWQKRKLIFYYSFATILQLLFNLIFLPLPWQRYVITLLPYTILWTAGAFFFLMELSKNSRIKNPGVLKKIS